MTSGPFSHAVAAQDGLPRLGDVGQCWIDQFQFSAAAGNCVKCYCSKKHKLKSEGDFLSLRVALQWKQ